jgi:hypothetical protein
MRKPIKSSSFTPKMLGDPIGSALTENGSAEIENGSARNGCHDIRIGTTLSSYIVCSCDVDSLGMHSFSVCSFGVHQKAAGPWR